MSVPGLYQDSSETPQAGCGCLVAAVLLSLIAVAALVGFALYATDLAEGFRQ